MEISAADVHLRIRNHMGGFWGIAIINQRICFVENNVDVQWKPMVEVPAKILEYIPVFIEQHYPLLSSEGYPTIGHRAASQKDATVQVKGMTFSADCNV